MTAPPLSAPASWPAGCRFGRFELDTVARRVLADGRPLAVGGRAFDLLVLLVQRAPHPVPGDELQRAVWPGRQVADSNVRVQVTALRKLLGDDVIEHQPTRGYRLTLAVEDGQVAAPAPPPVPGNLPGHLPPLFDRARERAELGAQLHGQARLTIAGPAGVGKTVLALALAHDRRAAHADGVWWIDLAPLGTAAQVAERIGTVLGLSAGDETAPLDAVARALAADDRLLVLDNAEHLAGPVAQLADALLRQAPRVALLATSRLSLKFAGEQVHRLGALSLPAAPGLAAARRSGALALFEARARRADPAFALTDNNVGAVAEVCRQLDGVALAIELAAARVPLLGVAGLRDRLVDRLRLLTSREPDARGQPQALQTALDWSHGLLPPREQAVLRRLGVFAGSFALETVQAVLCGLPASDAPGAPLLDHWAVLDALNLLLDHSLLMPVPGTQQGAAPARCTLHESVRLYARERLAAHAEQPLLQQRHARALLARVTGRPGLAGDADDRDRDCMAQLLDDADHDNLRAAWAWAAEHDIDLAMRLVNEANAYLRQRGHHREARQWSLQLLADPRADAHPRRLARVALGITTLCYEQSALQEALGHAATAIQHLAREPDARSLGEAHGWIGSAHYSLRNFEIAEQAFRQSIAFHTEDGYEAGVGDQLNNLGLLMVEMGRHAEADAVLQQALALQRRVGGDWGVAMALENLGEAAWARLDADTAVQQWQQALQLMRQLGNLFGEALLLVYLALAAWRAGRPDEAHALLRVSLSISRPRQLHGLVGDAFTVLAGLAADGADPRRAALLLGAAERQRSSSTVTGPLSVDLPALVAAVQGALGSREWHAARAEGERLAPDDVVV
jgi:predicted ATPase/DNA-binding winged helix-turn-helix (wHTH) protein